MGCGSSTLSADEVSRNEEKHDERLDKSTVVEQKVGVDKANTEGTAINQRHKRNTAEENSVVNGTSNGFVQTKRSSFSDDSSCFNLTNDNRFTSGELTNGNVPNGTLHRPTPVIKVTTSTPIPSENEVDFTTLRDPAKKKRVIALRDEILQSHNKNRAMHGYEPLTLDNIISNYAQEYAEYLSQTNTFKHRENNTYGENLYASFSSANNKSNVLYDFSGTLPVNSFYDEIKDYDFSKPGFSTATGHFTQMIWKETQELGVGIAQNPNHPDRIVVVCNYQPPGNIGDASQYEQNVTMKIIENN